MGDVGAVITVAILEKHFRQDELRGRGDADGRAIDLDLINLLEPLVGDGDAGGRDVVDDVEEVRAVPDLADLALVLELDPLAARLDQKRLVEGTRVSVRVDLGGSSLITKKK